jgi:hypothetical protein
VKRWSLAVALLTGCAHVEAPPGGPEDRTAPTLVSTQPDTLAVVPPFAGPVILAFDERLSERGLEESVLVSPLTSPPVVDHRGNQIRVSLRRGWVAGQVYQITVLPGVQDLWNNRIAQPITLVFSTGPAIPNTRLAGSVVDRITGRPEIGQRVEAVRQADSLVYATATDSAGAFLFSRIPAGPYQIRAFRDLNRNRTLDDYEPFDVAAVTVTAGATEVPAVRLAIAPPDTTPPVVASASVSGTAIQVQFDDYLDPAQPVTPAQVQITGPGGQAVAVSSVRIGQERGAPADTAAAGRLPSQTLSVEPAAALTPRAEYRIRVTGIRNIRGLTGGGEATFRAPAAAPSP